SQYARRGIDPTGALRALLEVWSADRTAALRIARERIADRDDTWNISVIKALYDVVVQRYAGDPKGIAELATTAGVLKNVQHSDAGEGAGMRRSVLPEEWTLIRPRLLTSSELTDHMVLVVHQVSSMISAEGDAPFLIAATGFSCRTITVDPLVKLDDLE